VKSLKGLVMKPFVLTIAAVIVGLFVFGMVKKG
jgi:hypothetical protein